MQSLDECEMGKTLIVKQSCDLTFKKKCPLFFISPSSAEHIPTQEISISNLHRSVIVKPFHLFL